MSDVSILLVNDDTSSIVVTADADAAREGLAPTSTASVGTEVSFPPQPTISGDTQAWRLVFEDDFEGDALDPTKWQALDGWTDQNGVTTLASNVSVSDSYLTLQLSDSTHGASVVGASGSSAGLDNAVTMPVGGYAEASCYFPGASGEPYNWSGWWLYPTDAASDGYCELDVFEGLGQASCNYHDSSGQSGPEYPTGDWTNAWHTYGVLRTATSVVFYWDGEAVYTVTPDDTPGVTLCLRFSIGYNQDGSGGALETGSAGAMLVDWVRVWIPEDMRWSKTATNALVRSCDIDGTMLPSPRFAEVYDYSINGVVTLQPPTVWVDGVPAPNIGDTLGFVIRQGSTGYAVTFESEYELVSGASIPTTADTVSTIPFEYDGLAWRQSGPVLTTDA